MQLPSAGKPRFLPRETWLGFYLEDAARKHRYVLGLFNPSWTPAPAQVPYMTLVYEKGGKFRTEAAKATFDCSRKRFFLRLTWADRRLVLADSVDGKTFVDRLTLTPPDHFAPSRLGLTLDSFHDKYAVSGFRVHNFQVDGLSPNPPGQCFTVPFCSD